MDMNSDKPLRSSKKCVPLERFRSFLFFTTVAFLVLSIVYLFIVLVSMKKELAEVRNELSTIKNSAKDLSTKTAETPLRRGRRASNSKLSVPELAKRIALLESRNTKLFNDTSGKASHEGRDGRDGLQGPPGNPGRDGRDGRQGPAGPRGLPGPKGDAGPKGIQGPVGSPGPKGEKGSLGQVQSGVIYNRWGRTTCYGDAALVYNGVMANGHHGSHGSGSNYLCLPNNPTHGKHTNGFQGAAIHSTEYESGSFLGSVKSLTNHDAPCAVCYVTSRSTKLMVPATNKCPSGWTKEYGGYLMSSHHDHKHGTEFVCVDVNAEVVPGSHRDTNGALLYLVETACNTDLPCKPYTNGHELTCVVCTK